MLRELHIENIAVIERAVIEFEPGLNILTGETGAGKSIVIDALGAALGERASRELVRTGADKASVSAVFELSGTELDTLGDFGYEPEDGELIFNRRVAPDGKSSCRVGGAPVPASAAREAGSFLLDIHGQNDGRRLMDESTHRAFLDSFARLGDKAALYGECYAYYKRLRGEVSELESGEQEKERLTELLRQTIEELEEASLRPGEISELETRRSFLRNAGKLTEAIEGAYAAIYEDETGALTSAGEAVRLLGRASELDPRLQKAEKSIGEAVLLLEDAAEILRDIRTELDFTPEEYDAVEERLRLINRLSRKYTADAGELPAVLERARERLEGLDSAGERLESLKRELNNAVNEVRAKAKELTAARKSAGIELAAKVERELRELSIPSARFIVEILPQSGEPGFDGSGADTVRFLISANAGEEPGRLSSIASGGELSRIMLAMKTVLAGGGGVKSCVFDEIDAGVSGVAASRVGEKLAALSRDTQVICVTHLPQIAAMADAHFRIEKSERGGRTFTGITKLGGEGRARELARLHGGDNVTETTLKSAREQLLAADSFKSGLRG